MKNIKIFLIGIVMALLAYGVSATNSCVTTADDGTTIIGISSFNATVTITKSGDFNASSPVLYGRCTDTANSSYNVLQNDTTNLATGHWTNGSDSNAGLTLNVTYNTAGLEDSANCAFYIVVYNGSQQNNSLQCTATSTSIIDNQVPDTPTITCDSALQVLSNNEVISYTVNGSETTSCNIYFDNNDYSMTHSGNTCTHTVTKGNPPDSSYEIYITATDGTNSTNSATCDVKVDAIPHGTGTSALDGTTVPLAQKVVSKKKAKDKIIIGLMIVFLMGWAIKKK